MLNNSAQFVPSSPMSNPAEQFKINLNQNLWGLLLGLAALISAVFTTIACTVNYWRNR
jgi:hypothetical protein